MDRRLIDVLSTLNASDVFEIVIVSFGIVLVLKRVADMDGYHKIRVAVLTVILSVAVILMFDGLGVRLADSGLNDCVIEFDAPSDHY